MATFQIEDLTATEVVADPHQYFRHLRETDPVHWNPFLKGWLVTCYEDVTWVVRNHELFSSEKQPTDPRDAYPPFDEADFELAEAVDVELRGFVVYPGPTGLIGTDRPAHLAMRQAVHRWFTPTAVEKWRERLREEVKRLVDDHRADKRLEVKAEFATPLPLATICWMMGIPEADAARMRDLVATLGYPGYAPDRLRTTVPALRELEEYFLALLEVRAKNPCEDLISMLVDGERRGVFTKSECVANAILLIAAGHDTTLGLICNGVLTFIRNPEQWDLLRSDPAGLCASGTEECLRFEPPMGGALYRVCTQEIELGGKLIPAGDRVYLLTTSANRDPRIFSDPDRFDITRSPNPHITFGGGIHHCLGAALARVEGQEAFRGLAENVERFQLDVDVVEYVPDILSRQLVSLPVSWS